MTRQITIGTRASPLALAQTEQIVAALQSAVGLPADAIAVKKFPPRAMRFWIAHWLKLAERGFSRMS